MKGDTAQAKRLARIEGQIRGISRMLDEDRRCEEVLIEIQAARSALKSLAKTLAESGVKELVQGAVGAPDTTRKRVSEAMRLLKYAS